MSPGIARIDFSGQQINGRTLSRKSELSSAWKQAALRDLHSGPSCEVPPLQTLVRRVWKGTQPFPSISLCCASFFSSPIQSTFIDHLLYAALLSLSLLILQKQTEGPRARKGLPELPID